MIIVLKNRRIDRDSSCVRDLSGEYRNVKMWEVENEDICSWIAKKVAEYES